jgi:hypothetical protein
MVCTGCVVGMYKDIHNYVCASDTRKVLLCGCSATLLTWFERDVLSRTFATGEEEADLAVVFGPGCSTEEMKNKLDYLSHKVKNILVYFYVGECQLGCEGKNLDFWMDYLKCLYGESVFFGIIGKGFAIASSRR